MGTTCPVVRQGGARLPTLSTVTKLYETLRAEVRRPGSWERDPLVFTAYLAYTGSRISEALKATAEDIFFDRGVVRIKAVKGGGFRVVPIPQELLYMLQRYIVLRGRTNELFPVSRRGATEWVYKETKRLIGCSMSPHLLRHAYAIKLLTQDGWTPGEVREALGHRRLSTTEVYTAYVGYSIPKRTVSL